MSVFFLVFTLFLLAIIVASNLRRPNRSASRPGRQSRGRRVTRPLPIQQVDEEYSTRFVGLEEFVLLKPAGFYRDDNPPNLEIYSEDKAGIMARINGKMVNESLRCAGAVVSVTPGDNLERCREAAIENAQAIISEERWEETQTVDEPYLGESYLATSPDGAAHSRQLMTLPAQTVSPKALTQRTLMLVVQKKFVHFTIETTHKVIVSCRYNKTYELRASVLLPEKAKYAEDVNTIVNSFRIV